MLQIIKKPTVLFSIIAILIGLFLGGYGYFKQRNSKNSCNLIMVKKESLLQEVNVRGKVEPAQELELAFEKSGRISFINGEVGQKVKEGDILAKLDAKELVAQLTQAQAKLENTQAQLLQSQALLEAEQAKLIELEKGTRPEEIKIAETKVLNARNSLREAEVNLENTKNKADVDLQADYQNTLAILVDSITKGKSALFTLTDFQYTYFLNNNQESIKLAQAKEKAVRVLLGKEKAGWWDNYSLSQLSGGAAKSVKKAQTNPNEENITKAISQTKEALKELKLALETIPLFRLTSAEQANLETTKASLINQLISLTNQEQIIEIQKATNQNNISLAKEKVIQAKNALALAEAELSLKKAGFSQEQIDAQRARVKQLESSLISQKAQIKQVQAEIEYLRTQLSKYTLYAPFDGIITKKEIEKGEIVSAYQPVISLISVNNFEIQANVPEVDIAKVKVGNQAKITFDAYGEEVIFKAKVVKIDPAETIIEGVATYKVTLNLVEKDKRIKPGLSADIDILTAKKENVLVIPQRGVIEKDGQKFVRVYKDGQIKEKEVKTGLSDGKGQIEIKEGLNEGDLICL